MVHLLAHPLQEHGAARIAIERQRRKQKILGAIADEAKWRDQARAVDFFLCYERGAERHAQPGTGGLQTEIEMLVGLAITMAGVGVADAAPICPGLFQQTDLPTDCAMRDPQLVASFGEAAQSGSRFEKAQCIERYLFSRLFSLDQSVFITH
jgi:hypothetical protein